MTDGQTRTEYAKEESELEHGVLWLVLVYP